MFHPNKKRENLYASRQLHQYVPGQGLITYPTEFVFGPIPPEEEWTDILLSDPNDSERDFGELSE